MRTRLCSFLLAFAVLVLPARSAPNVIIILADDLGWPDVGAQWTADLAAMGLNVQAATDLLTPRINTLAQNGVRFTSGYVTCPLCSPSRAGLMSGRYPQRFGYEMNPGPKLEYSPVFGLPLTECTMGERMKALGYATAWIGKSHLGALDVYHPVNRGFDEFFGFLEGHHDYCAEGNPGGLCLEFDPPPPPKNPPPPDPIQHAFTPVDATHRPAIVGETEYLTKAFGRETARYINKHMDQENPPPFFLYVPFNGVHEPRQATEELLTETAFLFPGETLANYSIRHSLAAMMRGVDKAVGEILDELGAHPGLMENTLIFFSSDNGAPPATRDDRNGSVSLPLKGNKSDLYEGGIRVPYILQWKGTLAARVVSAPVSTMDILPTCVAAAGGTIPAAWQLDGVNLLPYLRGQTTQEPHPVMYWRVESGRSGESFGPRALRKGNWKIIKPHWGAAWELYDLATPNGLRETDNFAGSRPDKLQELIPIYDEWEATLPRPRWDYNDPNYVTPTFVLDDRRLGSTADSYLGPEFLPGTNQMAFQDQDGKLWRSTIDLRTGFLTTATDRDVPPVDTGLTAPSVNNEGPQWGVSASAASLFYTKPGTPSHLQIWRSGTQLTAQSILDSFGPRVSQEPASPVVGMVFNRGVGASSTALVATDSAPAATVSLPNQALVERNGRWIPGTTDIVYVRTGSPTQLARYNTAAGTSAPLTDDPAGALPGIKTDAWAFYAPEFGHELCYACVVDRKNIVIYRDLHRGGGLVDAVATLAVPATETAHFLFQMKPLQGARGFNGVTWFSCAAYQNPDVANPGASAIWLLGLGPDETARLPLPLPVPGPGEPQLPNDPCDDWKSRALRVSDPLAAGVALEPETVIGEREVFCYYTRKPATGPVQLRLARTGLMKPDAPEVSGFTALKYVSNYRPGDMDGAQRMGGTETTALVRSGGRLFAAMSSRDNVVTDESWTGVQILRKDSPIDPWRVDHSGNLSELFKNHRAADVLTELTFTRKGPDPLNGGPVKHLVAGLSDLGTTGETIASARTRRGPGQWVHSTVVDTLDEAAHSLSFAVHLDRDINNDGINDPTPQGQPLAGEENVFAGLSNGEIYRGIYDPEDEEHLLVWNAVADLADTTVKLGPVTGLADANGFLYAACGMRQDTPADPVTGGLYVRNDHTNAWQLIYAWPTPLPVHTAPEKQRIMTSLTAVPDPRGCAHEVLLAARSWPGVVELIDPRRNHAVTVELDVRDFFARRWNDSSVRSQDVSVGYTPFTPAADPVTGRQVHLLGVWIEQPGAANGDTHFLIRHFDGTWEAADIPGANLRGTRCFAVSPFASDAGAAFYFGGYDTGGQPAEDTAWIFRGIWTDWPELAIAPDSQNFQLTWPFTTLDWTLESSPDLTNWLPAPEKPARSITGTSVSVDGSGSRTFYRLRR